MQTPSTAHSFSSTSGYSLTLPSNSFEQESLAFWKYRWRYGLPSSYLTILQALVPLNSHSKETETHRQCNITTIELCLVTLSPTYSGMQTNLKGSFTESCKLNRCRINPNQLFCIRTAAATTITTTPPLPVRTTNVARTVWRISAHQAFSHRSARAGARPLVGIRPMTGRLHRLLGFPFSHWWPLVCASFYSLTRGVDNSRQLQITASLVFWWIKNALTQNKAVRQFSKNPTFIDKIGFSRNCRWRINFGSKSRLSLWIWTFEIGDAGSSLCTVNKKPGEFQGF